MPLTDLLLCCMPVHITLQELIPVKMSGNRLQMSSRLKEIVSMFQTFMYCYSVLLISILKAFILLGHIDYIYLLKPCISLDASLKKIEY